MSAIADLVVLGGGIAGLSTALAAASRGMRVVVLDDPRPGAASRASAGLLAPSLEGLSPRVRPAALAARDFYPQWLALLRDRTGLHVPLDREGILELASSEAELETLLARAPATAERLDASALGRIEPALGSGMGALLHPTDGAVDTVALMAALQAAVEGTTAIRRHSASASAITLSGSGATASTPTGERFQGAALVLATGAWAGRLEGLPRALPVRPVRGQLLLLAGCPLGHVVYGGGGYLVPRGACTLIGATTEHTGFDVGTTAEGRETLLGIAARVLSGRPETAVVDHWAGLRPVTPDALPILGPDRDEPALHYACGFSRNGILLAPWATEQLAGSIAGGEPVEALAPFHVERFERQPVTDY